MPGNRNYYKDLGITPNASQSQIEEAWKAWKRDPKNHPDTHSDPKDKDRVERHFQEHSAAYLVLSKPAERRKYEAELEHQEEKAKRAAQNDDTFTVPKRPTKKGQDPFVYGFHGSDPSSEEANWGGGSSAKSQWQGSYAHSYSTAPTGLFAPFLRYLRLTPLLIITSSLVGIWILYIALSPHPAPSDGVTNPITVQNTPSSNPDPGIVAGTPTPTPSSSPTLPVCPSGAPEVSVSSAQPTASQSSGFGNQSYTYSVTGTVSNPTNQPVQIGSIGFYLGSTDSNSAPAWTDELSDMTVSPSSDTPDVIAPGSSVTFQDESSTIPSSDGSPASSVNATLDYPNINNGPEQSNWAFVSGSCQTSSGSD